MKPKTYIGVDCGVSGSVAHITGDKYSTIDIPSYIEIVKPAKRKKVGVFKNGKDKWKTITPAKTRKHTDFKELGKLLSGAKEFTNNNMIVYIEKQACRPMNSTASCSKTMFNYGRYIQLLECLSVEYVVVLSSTWKKHFGLIGEDYKNNKDIAIEKAKSLGFESDVKRADVYEAWLIARYAKDINENV